ncbi:MAG: sulfite exporter TauE/SafE family protein [Hyphomicrobiales bacterium]
MTLLDAVLIVLLAGGASVVQTLTGLGFSLMMVPPLILVVGVKDAVVVSNILGTVVSAVLLTRTHRWVEWRTGGILLAASVVGMPAGLAVLVLANPDVLQVVIALAVMAFTVMLARGLRLHSAGLAGDAGAGIVSGILRMSTSMSGPPVAIYLQGKGLDSIAFRATLSAFFMASGVIGIGFFAAGGRINGEVLAEAAVAVPALLAGFAAGQALYRRVDEARFRRVVIVMLLVSSLMAMAAVAVH